MIIVIDRQTIAALLASRSTQPHRGQSAPQVTSVDEGKDVEEIPDPPLLLGQARDVTWQSCDSFICFLAHRSIPLEKHYLFHRRKTLN